MDELTDHLKWVADGATTLTEARKSLQTFQEYLSKLEREGWQLSHEVDGGYLHLVKQSGRVPVEPVEELMIVADVAKRWRVSAMTIYRLIHAGELKALRFGRSFRVPRSAMEEYELEKMSAREGAQI